MKSTHDNNFWEVNSDLIILDEFSKLYYKDKSKDKQDSSKILWAIFYAYNPESKFFNYPNKQEVISQSFLKDPKFKWEDYKDLIEAYKNIVLTDAERALINWNEIMTMRDQSIKDLYKKAIEDSDTDELVKIDKMLANTPKMFEDYKKIKKDYEEEKVTKKGKTIASLSDSGEL
jgi:hypothetical protein